MVLWGHGLVVRRLPDSQRRRIARRLLPLVLFAATALLTVAVVGMSTSTAFAAAPEAPGLALAVGILLLAYAVRLFRVSGDTARAGAAGPNDVAEWGAVTV